MTTTRFSLLFLGLGFALGGAVFYPHRPASEPAKAAVVPAERKPEPEMPTEFLFDLAEVYAKHGETGKAEEYYRKAAAAEKNAYKKSLELCGLGELLSAKGEREEAKKCFAESAALATDDHQKRQLFLRMGEAYKKAGLTQEAEEAFGKNASLTSDPLEQELANRNLLELYRTQGRLEDMAKEFQGRLQVNPADVTALKNLAVIYWEMKRDPSQAVPVLAQLAEVSQDAGEKSRYYAELAGAYTAKRDYAKSAEAMQKAIANCQNLQENVYLHLSLAQSYRMSKQYAEAESALVFVVEHAGSEAERRSARAEIFNLAQKQGKLEALMAEKQKALAENPKDENALRQLGEIYAEVLRKPGEAAQYYEQLNRLAPENTDTRRRLAEAYAADRKYAESAAIYEDLLKKRPELRLLCYGKLSYLYCRMGKKEEAIKWAKLIAAESPNDGYGRTVLIDAYLQNGFYGEAEAELGKAMQASGSQEEMSSLQMKLVDVYARSGKRDKARALLEEIIASGKPGMAKTMAEHRLKILDNPRGGPEAKAPGNNNEIEPK